MRIQVTVISCDPCTWVGGEEEGRLGGYTSQQLLIEGVLSMSAPHFLVGGCGTCWSFKGGWASSARSLCHQSHPYSLGCNTLQPVFSTVFPVAWNGCWLIDPGRNFTQGSNWPRTLEFLPPSQYRKPYLGLQGMLLNSLLPQLASWHLDTGLGNRGGAGNKMCGVLVSI